MGIKGLNQIVKKQNPNVYHTCHYTSFYGKSLAMDVSIFLHKYVHADRKTWFTTLVNFFVKMRRADINIVAVFDGKNVPIEKMLERENRKVSSNKMKDKLSETGELKELIYLHYIPDEEYCIAVKEEHQVLVKALIKKDDIDYSDAKKCIYALSEMEEKIANQSERIGQEHLDASKALVQALGIPYLDAWGEAEALCASLAYHGYVDGVLSRDTDSLAYCAPLFVCEFQKDIFTWTTFKEVLEALQLTKSEFIDFCIMCGCDYNTNMPGIGGGKAFKKITEYGTIERIEANENVDTTCLRYKRCREIFVPYDKVYLEGYKIAYKGKPNAKELSKLFQRNNCRIPIQYIISSWEPKLEFID